MAAQGLKPAMHPSTGKFGGVVVLDLGVEKLDPVIQVAPVERLGGPPTISTFSCDIAYS